jgi:hypothetical protein
VRSVTLGWSQLTDQKRGLRRIYGGIWQPVLLAWRFGQFELPFLMMAMVSDLVNDSKLPVQFFAERTHHVVFESDATLGQQVRRQRKEEIWGRVKHLGKGGFGSVWLEQCLTTDSQPKSRAVKEIPKVTPFSQTIDYKRELETIAKFSQRKVRSILLLSCL